MMKWNGLPVRGIGAALTVFVFAACVVPTMAQLSQRAAQPAEVSTDGVTWPADYLPEPTPVVLPSTTVVTRAPVVWSPLALSVVDAEALAAEDALLVGWDNPPRVGVSVLIDEELPGAWTEMPDGGMLWTASITSDGARALRVHFSELSLPAGAALYVYSPKHPEVVQGPYFNAGPLESGEFWSGSVTGDTVHIEYYVPADAAAEIPFTIDEIGHIYREIAIDSDTRAALDCMGDVACYSAWEDVSYAVARMLFQGDDGSWYNCSGTLVAAQNGDMTPYFLTAAHCIDTANEAHSLEARWFYQNSTCGGSLMASQYSNYANLLGTSGEGGAADWSLLMIEGVLPAGVQWAGWTSSNPANGTWSVGVHHPSGSWKRYSRGRKRSTGLSDFHRIEWDVSGAIATIYYGSSGSGIYREDNQQLYGICSFGYGEAGCDNLNVDIYYGKFSYVYSAMSSLLAAGTDDGFENNDSCGNAATLSEGSHSNLIVKSTDEDWYRVYLQNGEQVEILLDFVDAYGNVDAELYDGCGGTLVASASTTSNDEALYWINNGPAQYVYLHVFLSDDTRNTYSANVTIGTFTDTDPPTPNPMMFAGVPVPASSSSISMTAATAVDLITPPVSYYFEGTQGGHDSGWQSSTAYTDVGLVANTAHSYRVKARDSAAPANETAYSSYYFPVTLIETPVLSAGSVSTNSIQLNTQSLTNLTLGLSGVYFDSETAGGDGGLNQWVQAETDTATSLAVNTMYAFRAKGRNQTTFETVWSSTLNVATHAVTPAGAALSNVGVAALNLDPLGASNPSYTEMAIQCVTTDPSWAGKYVSAAGIPSTAAVWRTDAAWGVISVSGLSADTEYCFQVKARNLDGVETAFSVASCATTPPDCNGNGQPDADDIAGGTSQDCDGNGVPDECDMAACGADPACADCNHNDVPDGCDISGGASTDTNGNGVPDECESPTYDVGDINCDGLVNNGDIDPFVLAITNAPLYEATYPDCDINLADINGDGLVNNGDIDPFVALITG